MRAWIASVTLIVALGFAGDAWAQCCAGGKGKAADVAAKSVADKAAASACCKAKSKAGNAATCDPSQCATASAACCAAPTMTYKVGDETLCCSKMAGALAAKKSSPIKYVVAGKEFSDEGSAKSAYADALEAHMKGFTTVRHMVGGKCVACPMQAKELAKATDGKMTYCVGSVTFDSMEKATAAARRAEESAEKIQMATLVDGKPYTCSKSANVAAEGAGVPCVYAVGDSCRTECKTTARIELARARIDAMMKSLNGSKELASSVNP